MHKKASLTQTPPVTWCTLAVAHLNNLAMWLTMLAVIVQQRLHYVTFSAPRKIINEFLVIKPASVRPGGRLY